MRNRLDRRGDTLNGFWSSWLSGFGIGLLNAVTFPFRRPARPNSSPEAYRTAYVAAACISVIATVSLLIWADPLAGSWRMSLPRWPIDASRTATQFGDSGWILWPTGLGFVALSGIAAAGLRSRANLIAAMLMARLGVVFLCVAVPGLAAAILKRVIGRARPELFDSLAHLSFKPIAASAKFASFPSGHATTVFAFAVVAGALWPRARGALFAIATLIALSRVTTGVHFPSDVVAGAIFGSLSSWLMVRAFAERRIVFAVDSEGKIRPMTGPSLRHVLDLLVATLLGSNYSLRRRRDPAEVIPPGIARSLTIGMFSLYCRCLPPRSKPR